MHDQTASPPLSLSGSTVLGEYTIGLYPNEDPYSDEVTWLLPYFPTDAIWLVYALYRSHRDDRELAYPSAKQIAQESGLCVRAVRQAISWLVGDGALEPVEPDEVRGPLRSYYPDADCRRRAGERILGYPACAGEPIITRAQLYFVNGFFKEGEPSPVPNWFLRDPNIPPGEKRLGALIGGLAQRRAFASVEWYANQLDVTPRTIARRVAFLRKEGKLEQHGKSESGTCLLSIPSEPPKSTTDFCQGWGASGVWGGVHQASPNAGSTLATPSAGARA
jgi:hypothetical protein